MKKDVKNLRKSILKSYRSLGKELKKLKRSALKNKDEALLEALDTAMDDSELFDANLVKEVKEETKEIVKSINEFWQGQEGTLTNNALTDAIKEGEDRINVDTVKPILLLVGEATVTIIEGTTYTDAGATASDNKDGDITSNIQVINPVDSNNSGTYSVTYDVSDSSGNIATQVVRTVKVDTKPLVVTLDTTKPVITLIGNATVTLTEGSVYTDAGATASDNKDGDITSNIQVTNPVDTNSVGTYSVIYDVNDSSGNIANQVLRSVQVEAKAIVVIPDTTKNYHIAKDNTLHDENVIFGTFTVVVYTDALVDTSSQSTKAIYGNINGSATNALLSVNANYLDGTAFIIKVFQSNQLVGESTKAILFGGTLEFSDITTK
jgi:hypothetical protein